VQNNLIIDRLSHKLISQPFFFQYHQQLRSFAITLSTNYNHEHHRGASTNDNPNDNNNGGATNEHYCPDNICGDDDNHYDCGDYTEPNV
jgi:hypothetical protein